MWLVSQLEMVVPRGILFKNTSLRFQYFFRFDLGSSVSSMENDINTQLAKAWTAIDRLSVIWKSDLSDKMERIFFQAAVMSILLYGCTTCTLTKRMKKKLDANCAGMLRALLKKNPGSNIPQNRSYTATYRPSLKPSKLDEQGMRGSVRRSKDELIRSIFLWTSSQRWAGVRRPC